MSADLAFQKVLFASIRAALPGVSCESMPPQDNPLPWVHIGESHTTEHPAGWEITATVHVWSQAEGAHEAKAMQEAIRAELHHTNHKHDGYDLRCAAMQDARVFLDVDDETWHGVQQFRVFAGLDTDPSEMAWDSGDVVLWDDA